MRFRSGMLAGQSRTVISCSANHLEVVLAVWAGAKVLLEKEISISIKLVSRCKHKMLQNLLIDSWIDFGLDKTQWTNTSRCHSTPNHHWLQKRHTGLKAAWILGLSDSGTLISKWNAKFTFIWKEDFGLPSNSPVVFLLSPGKMLLTVFLFQKWLGSSFPEDVWAWWLLTPASVHSLWSSLKCLNQLCLTVFSSLHHPCCLCTFSYPMSSFQSTFNLICFDTALLEQPPLSVMTLCDLLSLWRVSMIVFWTIVKSACSPFLWFQRTRDTHNLYCMDGHLLKLKYKYFNILIF